MIRAIAVLLSVVTATTAFADDPIPEFIMTTIAKV